MRRSSWIMLILAAVVMAACIGLYARAGTYADPPLTTQLASKMIERGESALERHDVNGIMDLMAPNAKILGRNTEETRTLIGNAFQEIQGHLEVTTRNLQARQQGDHGEADFDMDIGQKTSAMKAVYYPNVHVRLTFERLPISHWMGLFTTMEWKISDMTTDPPIETAPL